MGKLVKRALPIVFASSMLCIGCHERSDKIAVIPRTTATLLWEPMHLGVAETARRSGLDIYWNAPADEGDTGRQLSLYSSLQSEGYKGIIFAPDETLASRSLVLETVKRGTAVVIVDDELGPAPGPKLSYVSTDEKLGASMAAQSIARLLHGEGTIAVMGINPRSEGSLSREEELEKALVLYAPGVTISARRFGDSVVTHQQQIAQEILDRSKKVDAILCLSATSTRGAYYAKLAEDGKSSVKIVGFDQDLMLPVKTGDVDAVVVQNTREIGRIAEQNVEAEMRGEKVEGVTFVPPLLLTKESLGSTDISHLWEFVSYPWSGR